mmetsp:Transcript_36715/g.44886  ORF Transcript_36715/g.44886 Transcript_36715/m.44886 type:complete len:99 (-) Transcript_36715:55-351(-)
MRGEELMRNAAGDDTCVTMKKCTNSECSGDPMISGSSTVANSLESGCKTTGSRSYSYYCDNDGYHKKYLFKAQTVRVMITVHLSKTMEFVLMKGTGIR